MWAPCPHFELFRTGWGYPQGCPHVLSRVFNIPPTCFVLENAVQVVSKSRQGARNHEHRFSRHGQRPAFFWCCPHVSGRLHMQALNCLSRSKAMLTANEPMYGFALPQPSRLLQRCNPLICRWGGKPCKPPKKNTLPPWQRRPSHAQNLPPAYHTHWAQCRPAQSADQPQSTPLGQ